MMIGTWRKSAGALLLAVCGWASGCATQRPMIEPFFAARTYTPGRIAVLPPDVFLIYDHYGDNDPARSAALGAAVAQQTVAAISGELRRRGYAVDLSARWDGIFDANGAQLVSREDLGGLANSVLQFANSPAGGTQGAPKAPAFVGPELAARVGAATASDGILYVNIKGVSVSQGKRAAQVIGAVFFIVVIAAIIALMVADGHGSSGKGAVPGGRGNVAGGGASRGVGRAVAPVGSSGATAGATRATIVPSGRGAIPGGRGGGGQVYGGGGPHMNFGVGVMIPLNEPVYTHDGTVADDDKYFAGDDLYVSLTLVSAHDGRVLWHVRDNVDIDAAQPREVDRFVSRYLAPIPPALRASPPQ